MSAMPSPQRGGGRLQAGCRRQAVPSLRAFGQMAGQAKDPLLQTRACPMATQLSDISPAPAFDSAEFSVRRIRALRGPNYWRLAPVIACDVRLGSLEQVTSAEIPGFVDRLLKCLPSLSEHPCSRGGRGGFAERLREGTHLPHVLEHVCLELQTLAGSDVSFGRVVQSGDPGVWWVIVAYTEEEIGIQAMYDAVDIISACIDGRPIGTDRILEDLRDLYQDSQ